MEYIKDFFSDCSNRDLALLIWIAIIFVLLAIGSKTRSSLLGIIEALFNKYIVVFFLMLLCYVLGLIVVLRHLSFWDYTLLKDTTFWFFGSALALFINVNKANDTSFFKSTALHALKLSILTEFFLNFYTGSFLIEFLALPTMVFLVLMKTVMDYQKKQNTLKSEELVVYDFLKNVIIGGGFVLVGYSIYRFVKDSHSLFSVHNFKVILLAPSLTILVIPYFYFLALYMQYEFLFVWLKIRIKDQQIFSRLFKEIVYSGNISLNRVFIIRQKIDPMLEGRTDIRSYIKSIK